MSYFYYMWQMLSFFGSVFLGAMLLYFIWSVLRDNFNLHELEDKVKNIFKGVNKKLDEKIIEDYAEGKKTRST